MSLPIGKATAITFKTLPYIFLRFFVYFLFGLGILLYGLLVYFVGQAAAHLHQNARVVVWILGFLLSFPITRLLREYVLYIIKAGHVAVIAELATVGHLPEGAGQVDWGRQQVTKTFKEVSVLFVMDRLVVGVIRSINGMMQRVGSLFSGIPGMDSITKFAGLVLRFSLTYVDEAILARNFKMQNESVWESAKKGLVLYAQSWQEILKTALFLGTVAFFAYLFLVILFLVPLWGISTAYPHYQWIFILAAFVFAAVLKLAFFDPWAMTILILTYLEATEGKIADPAWEEKLQGLSSSFKKIRDKALQAPQI